MYAKLFSSILDSSLWTADPATRILFLTMLAMADREGRIFASKSGLMRRACIVSQDFERALDTLMKPDEESSDLTRNPDNAGRRIEAAEGGWVVLNYTYYRDLQDADERRHNDKMRKRKQREGQRGQSRKVTNGHARSRPVTENPPSEAEAYSYSETPPTPPTGTGTRRRGRERPGAPTKAFRSEHHEQYLQIEREAEANARAGPPKETTLERYKRMKAQAEGQTEKPAEP